MKTINKKLMMIVLTGFLVLSCHSDLDLEPIADNALTELDVYENEQTAFEALVKLYQSYTTASQLGGNDSTTPPGPDISGLIGSAVNWSDFVYLANFLNDVSTEVSIVAWTTPGIQDVSLLTWTSQNFYSNTMYYRLSAIISYCNSFLENIEVLEETEEVISYKAEARFLRALAYYHMMDFYANVPIVTTVSTDLPEQNSRSEIFSFVESELLDIEGLLKESGTNDYGRVDEVAAWALLSRLYLNAEVWTGENRYSESASYAEAAINSTYKISTTDVNNNGSAYDELFLADNNSNGAQNEFILTANYDGLLTSYWGGATNLVHGYLGGSIDPALYGVNGGWWGLRTTKTFVEKFDYAATDFNDDGEPIAWNDTRALFYTDGQSYEINDQFAFTEGYIVAKWSNLNSDGTPGSDQAGNWVDTDVPLIRLAEMHLNYAEAVLRGGSGDLSRALSLINELRTRASAPMISESDLTLEFMLDERAREMYLEGNRRTDLIRYDLFTGNTYVWPFKGGISSGTGVDSYRNIFPIPADLLLANPNLEQNPNY